MDSRWRSDGQGPVASSCGFHVAGQKKLYRLTLVSRGRRDEDGMG
jgi:hypothetical protein